jgi:hypothetical protein
MIWAAILVLELVCVICSQYICLLLSNLIFDIEKLVFPFLQDLLHPFLPEYPQNEKKQRGRNGGRPIYVELLGYQSSIISGLKVEESRAEYCLKCLLVSYSKWSRMEYIPQEMSQEEK